MLRCVKSRNITYPTRAWKLKESECSPWLVVLFSKHILPDSKVRDQMRSRRLDTIWDLLKLLTAARWGKPYVWSWTTCDQKNASKDCTALETTKLDEWAATPEEIERQWDSKLWYNRAKAWHHLPYLPEALKAILRTHLANGPWKKSLNFIFPTKYGIPKSLKG